VYSGTALVRDEIRATHPADTLALDGLAPASKYLRAIFGNTSGRSRRRYVLASNFIRHAGRAHSSTWLKNPARSSGAAFRELPLISGAFLLQPRLVGCVLRVP